MVQAGLFRKTPVRSTCHLVLACLSYTACIAALAVWQNTFFIIADAVVLAIVSAQFGFLMHDSGHKQVFKSARLNTVFSAIAAFANGASSRAWRTSHNLHHEHPNHEDEDPDLDIYFIAYSEKQIDERGTLLRLLAPYQAYYALVLYTFVVFFMRYGNIPNLVRKQKPVEYITDLSLMVLWHVVYFGALFTLVGFWGTLLFTLIHHAVTGLHLALAFAPNHKGMPMLEKEDNINWFTKQVVTARNIYDHPLTNFLYGGLNFQIEHHLFPTMPRAHLKRAHEITKKFCRQKHVDYCETGILQSYRAVFSHLHEVGQYARNIQKPISELQQQLHTILAELEEHIDALKDHEIVKIAKQKLKALQQKNQTTREAILRTQKEAREIIASVRLHLKPLRS